MMKTKINCSVKHFTKITFCLTLLFALTFNIQAKNLYVSVNSGSENNAGTSASAALKTLQGAMYKAKPGDVVNVMAGTYNSWNQGTSPNASLLWIEQQYSGSPGNPITYRANPGDEGKVILQNHQGESVIHVNGADYIIIDGFKVQGQATFHSHEVLKNEYYAIRNGNSGITGRNGGSGIMVQGQNHNLDLNNPAVNVIIRNCDISKCTGSGIAVNLSAKVLIEGNKVYNNAKYSVRGTSGISIFRPIDCSSVQSGRNCNNFPNTAGNNYSIIIRDNLVYDNDNLYECDCSGYNQITDGNGIIIDLSNQTSSQSKFLIENNIVFKNGGKGVHVYNSNNTDIINNTLYQNGMRASQDRPSDISVFEANNVKVYNNITNPVSNINSMYITRSSNVKVSNNVHAKGIKNDNSSVNKSYNLNKAPLFGAYFTLQASSPAINFGNSAYTVSSTDIIGKQRIQGPAVDAGAFETASNNTPTTPTNPTNPTPPGSCNEKLINANLNTPDNSKIPGWYVHKGPETNVNGFVNAYGVAQFNIANGGANDYDVQMMQGGLTFKANTTYVLKVRIRADQTKNVRVVVRPMEFANGQQPFNYFVQNLQFGAYFTEFTYHFKPDRDEPKAYITFLLGGDNTNVYIDKVSVAELCNNGKLSDRSSSLGLAKVYPNPVSDYLKVQLYDQIEDAEITVFDVHGKLMHTQTISYSEEASIDMSKLVSGSYFVRIQSGDSVETQKILKY